MKVEPSLLYDRAVHTIVGKINKNPNMQDDLIQIGRMAVLQGLNSYDPTAGKMSKYSWCCQYVVRDVCRAIERESKHHEDHMDIDELLDLDDVDELTDYDHQNEIQLRIDVFNMLSALPEPERRMVIAHIFDDLSYTEIAYANSLNKQAVYRIVTAGIGILREKFS